MAMRARATHIVHSFGWARAKGTGLKNEKKNPRHDKPLAPKSPLFTMLCPHDANPTSAV